MAATVLSASTTIIAPGVVKVTVTVPTTVDGTDGATADFTLPRARSIGLQGVSSNFNGKTLALQAAPDGSNFVALPTAVSLTSSGIKSVALADCAFLNYRLAFSGAPVASLVATLIANCEV